jgi:hypothetical protein
MLTLLLEAVPMLIQLLSIKEHSVLLHNPA